MQGVQAGQMPLSGFFAQLMHTLFQNPVAALAQGDVLAVVVFSLLLGIALVIGGERYANILILLQEFLELMLMLVGWIMRLAPLGIMALLAKACRHSGHGPARHADRVYRRGGCDDIASWSGGAATDSLSGHGHDTAQILARCAGSADNGFCHQFQFRHFTCYAALRGTAFAC